jgi:hypothetical protein
MSSRATAWCWTVKLKPGSAHHLLCAMCEHANFTTNLSYPSVETLCDMTGQDRKTVLAGLQRLIDAGLMIDTGKKTGRTGQIPVYKMLIPDEADRGKNGTVKQSRKRRDNSTVFPGKESRIRDTEPIREPSIGTDSNHYADGARDDKDLFGQPVVSAEQREAEVRAQTIAAVEQGWADLSAEIPGVKPLRGGKLDEARAETAVQRAAKFAADGETPADIWATMFRQIRSSRWLCGEIVPRDDRPPFGLQMTWLLENRNFTKVLEGKFSDGRNPDLRGGGNARSSPAGEALSIVLNRRRAGRDRRNGRGSGRGAGAG